ncbi:MAG TPA: glycosyltransferase [Candidatus Baltobacteraceae bacterium]|nr:glycosyltransferase [Candidatus Baltobacteraceae bacterium]
MPLEIVDDHRDSAFASAQTGLLFNLPAPPADRAQLPEGVTLCMIVKNEERFLGACLASVRGAVDEIVVVDTGSTDRTVEIAREHAAIVLDRPWRDDFAWAKNEALAVATRRWIIVLDADEELVPESLPLLRALRATPAHDTAVYVHIRNVVDDESGSLSTMTHILPRVFPNSPRLRYRGVIHESLVVDDTACEVSTVFSPIAILHKGYTKSILDGRKKTERNRPLLERALAQNGDDPFAWFNFGVAAIAAGEYAEGIAALEKMFANTTEPRTFFPVAFGMLATAYGDGLGDRAKALEVLERGLSVVSEHPNLLFLRGYVLSQEGRYEEARHWYDRAIAAGRRAHPQFAVDDEVPTWKAPVNVAITYLREGRDAEAIVWLEKALEAKPDADGVRNLAASVCERVGRMYDAERLLRAGAASESTTGFIAYVNFLMRRRRFHEAFEQVERRRGAIDDPTYATLLYSAALAMRDEKLGDPEPYALRALELAPGDGRVLPFLDALYEQRGERERRDALRARELAAPLRFAADFARRSHRLLQEQRVADALRTAEDGLALAPSDAVLRYNAALAAARLGRDDDALAHLTNVGDDDAHASAAFALRSEIERRAGDLDAAIASLRRACEAPRPDATTLRAASVGLAGALLEAGRLGDAGSVAQLALA